jgi:outer membrane receptor protein involved in Fe transport
MMKRAGREIGLLALGLCSLTALSFASADQAAAAVGGEVAAGTDSPRISTDNEASGLQEIVVTAQRRRENLQDVPIAVTALTSDELKASGIETTKDLATVTTGLTMPESVGYVTPHIRGVGATAVGAGLENSVALYIDGVYIANAPSSIVKLDDIARVEVLKGPQGTLFGRNATGGLIQIETKNPSANFGGNASVGFGNYETTTGTLYLTGGLMQGVAADLSVLASFQGDGYGRDLSNGKEAYKDTRNIAARSKWVIEPDEDTSLRIAFDYSEDAGNEFESSHAAPGTKPVFGATFSGRPWDTDNDFQPYNYYKGGGVSARLDRNFADVELVNIIAYRKSQFSVGFDADLTPLPYEAVTIEDHENQFSEELQLLSRSQEHIAWVAGVYYFHSKGGYYPDRPELGGPLAIYLGPPPAAPFLTSIRIVGDQVADSVAGYGQATANVADRTKLTLGLRYSYERRELNATEHGYFPDGTDFGNLIQPITGERASFEAPTWRVALDHKFTDDVLGYVSYNRGFKSGGFNVGVPTDPAFKPEKLDAYELGLKTDLIGHRLRLNSAAYYYDYRNVQVADYLLGQVGYYNGAAAKLYGLDLDLEAEVARNFQIRGGLSLNHSDFSSFPNAIIATPQPAGGSIITTGSATGNALPYAPRVTANIVVDYQVPTHAGTFHMNATDYYSNGYYTAPDNIPRQPAYDIVNASLLWVTPAERYSVRFWGRNLFNKAVASAINESAIATLVHYQAPRSYGVTVAAEF